MLFVNFSAQYLSLIFTTIDHTALTALLLLDGAPDLAELVAALLLPRLAHLDHAAASVHRLRVNNSAIR